MAVKPTQSTESYEESLSDTERTHNFYVKWLLGVAVSLAFASYGTKCIIIRIGQLPDRHNSSPLVLHGANAVALGLGYLSIALFVHCRFYWGSKYEEIWFAQLGHIIAGVLFIGAMGVLIVRVGVYGIA